MLNKEVVTIDHRTDTVRVVCRDGSAYEAMCVLVTVPLPLIPVLHFVPALPKKVEAAGKIGFGPVVKILMKFKTKWWTGAREKVFERLFFMFSNEAIPTWWTQYPEPHTTLTGWVAGPKAHVLMQKTKDEIKALALTSLSNIFAIPVPELQEELEQIQVFDWANDPFARGAYSYDTPEKPEALKELNKPEGEKIFFAGEGLFDGPYSAMVEGALHTGKDAAERILSL
jgi:monoamine oxidase